MKDINFVRYISLGLVVLVFFLVRNTLTDMQIAKAGLEIKAIVIEMPENCSDKNIYSKFKYKEKYFTERVWKNFCLEKNIGDTIVFFHLEKYPERFVFSTYKKAYLDSQFISSFLLGCLGLYGFLYSLRKKEQS